MADIDLAEARARLAKVMGPAPGSASGVDEAPPKPGGGLLDVLGLAPGGLPAPPGGLAPSANAPIPGVPTNPTPERALPPPMRPSDRPEADLNRPVPAVAPGQPVVGGGATSRVEMGTQQPTPRPDLDLVERKREIPIEDLRGVLQGAIGAAPGSASQTPPPEGHVYHLPFGVRVDTSSEATNAFLHSFRRGAQALVTGPVQFGLEQVAPEAAKAVTGWINRQEEPYNEVVSRHPITATVGEIAGSVAAIMATGGLLGAAGAGEAAVAMAPRAAQFAREWPRFATLVGGVTTGAVLGGTTYNPQPEQASRGLEAVIGGAFGAVGAGIANGLSTLARRAGDRFTQNAIIQEMQQATQRVGRNTDEVRGAFLERYTQNWEAAQAEYQLRNAAGEEVRGIPSNLLDDAVKRVRGSIMPGGGAGLEEYAGRRFAQDKVAGVVQRVERTLELPEERARQAAATARTQQYVEQIQARRAELAEQYGRMREPQRTQYIRAAEERLPPIPQPEPYQPKPVDAAGYARAVQMVNEAVRAARKARQPNTVRQLTILGTELDRAVGQYAQQFGVNAATFLRRQRAADEFFHRNIGPVYDEFGRLPPRALERQVTPAMFFDRAVSVVEGGDIAKIRAFRGMLGPRGQEQLTDVMLNHMLTRPASYTRGSLDVDKVVSYFQRHQGSLSEVLGRDPFRELQGLVRVTERLGHRPELARHLLHGSWLYALGAGNIVMGMASMRGSQVLHGVSEMAIPAIGHILYRIMYDARSVVGVLPLVRRAAHTRSDGAAMDRIVEQIGTLYGQSVTGAGVGVAREVSGGAFPGSRLELGRDPFQGAFPNLGGGAAPPVR